MKQHTQPCGDCPWRRVSAPGWLGARDADFWLQAAHGECAVDCHTVKPKAEDRYGSIPQCAGMAIYRGNVAKTPRDPTVLKLPADRETVFATPMQFKEHHEVFKSNRAAKED